MKQQKNNNPFSISQAIILSFFVFIGISLTSHVTQAQWEQGVNRDQLFFQFPLGQVGIGTGNAPAERLHLVGNFRLDGGDFRPGNNPGILNNDILVSQGPGIPPIWSNATAYLNDKAWLLLGNTGTNPANNFLGTIDAQDLVFRTANVERVRILQPSGNVGIGLIPPFNNKLQVNGSVRVGRIETVTLGAQGYGDTLLFSGGPWTQSAAPNVIPDGDNTDPMWMARFNVRDDQTELRMNIGDNAGVLMGQNTFSIDKFVIGSTISGAGGAWNPRFTFNSWGQLVVTAQPLNPLNATGFTGASFIGTQVNNLATSVANAIPKIGLDVQSTGGWTAAGSTNVGLNVNVAGGTTNFAGIFMGGNVGIGTVAPTDMLHLIGNFRLDGGDFRPGNNPGTANTDILVSQGASTPPIWSNATTYLNNKAWLLLGNTGTNPANNFLGTIDAQDLVFRTANVERVRILQPSGNVGIGLIPPFNNKLQVNGSVRVGRIETVTLGAQGYGDTLLFSGGPWTQSAAPNVIPDGDNTDPMWMARFNVRDDQTELRMNIGDNAGVLMGQNTFSIDKFVIGSTISGAGGAWNPRFTFNSWGQLVVTAQPLNPLNATGFTGASFIGTQVNNLATSVANAIPKIGLDVQSTGGWTAAGSTNVGLNVNVAGGTTNFAGIFMGGNVGIGTAAPANRLEVNANGVAPAGGCVSGLRLTDLAVAVPCVNPTHKVLSVNGAGDVIVVWECCFPTGQAPPPHQDGDQMQNAVLAQSSTISSLQERLVNLEKLVDILLDQNKTQNRNIASDASIEQNRILPTGSLFQNDPNPFSASTTISYSIPNAYSKAELDIIEISSGKNVRRIDLANSHNGQVIVDSENLNSGIYLYYLIIDGIRVDMKKMTVNK